MIFLAKFTTFCPPDRFSPFPQDSSFSQIDPLTRDISRSLVIFHHICFFQLFCQVLAVFANSPFDQGYLTEHPLHIRRTFCDLSPFLSFSPSLSGFRPFFQIVILPWISLGHSIQFPLFGNFLVTSPIFTLLVRFWFFFSRLAILPKNLLEPHFNLRQPFGDFSCQIHNFSPSWQVLSVSAGFVVLVRLTIWPGTSHGCSIKFQSIFLWSFTISAFFNFSVRFWPFLPIRHLTRDISLSRHYIFVERFVIFHHICHFNLSGYVFVGFELPVISTNLFTFFWQICQFHPFGQADSPFYQKNLLQPYLRGNFRLLLVLYLLPEFTGPTVSITWTKYWVVPQHVCTRLFGLVQWSQMTNKIYLSGIRSEKCR